MKSGGTIETASWREIAPASVARFMNSWIAASHGSCLFFELDFEIVWRLRGGERFVVVGGGAVVVHTS